VKTVFLKLVAWFIAKLNKVIPDVDQQESAFFNQTCVKCGAEFDVPPDLAFDRRRAYYCTDCV